MDKVVTISRQYGSGGREIGQKLAAAWDIPFYDNELITRAAKDSGFAETAFENAESRANNSLLYSIARGTASFGGQDMGFSIDSLSLDDKIYLAQAKIIRNCAAEGPCVIVGRCADYILRKLDNLVNIFVYADMEFRVERAMRIDGMPPEKIESAIQKIDKRRSNYHNFHTGEKWGRIENYSLCINSGHVGIDKAVEVIKAYVEGVK
ncbi:MAG: cytidylate kinase-like family protein [Lachnospiraceae bacterium]|nr:cytidylate kinase-like family protein [Lachnospiraceae bacterium]